MFRKFGVSVILASLAAGVTAQEPPDYLTEFLDAEAERIQTVCDGEAVPEGSLIVRDAYRVVEEDLTLSGPLYLCGGAVLRVTGMLTASDIFVVGEHDVLLVGGDITGHIWYIQPDALILTRASDSFFIAF